MPTEPDTDFDLGHADKAPVVETLLVRDPDGGTEVTVFIDGHQVNHTEYVVDPGAGHLYSDWVETAQDATSRASSSEVREAVQEAFENPPGGSEFIEGFPD